MAFTKKEILPLALIVFIFLVSALFYSSLPDQVPSHWNIQGEVDDWSSKGFFVWFYPLLTLGIYLLMFFLPRIDPLRKNYLKFAPPYFWFRTVLVLFFVLLYLYSLFAALGGQLNINYFIIPAISLLFIVIGLFLPKIKKNYFVGIRTPWTLHSEKVWDETHRIGGRFFVLAGLIALLSLLLPESLSFFVLIGGIMICVLIPVVYSYFAFKGLEGFNNNAKDRS